MSRAVRIAAALAAAAVVSLLVRRAARRAPPAASFGAESAAKLAVLQDILSSRNDNDPRLDREFNFLSDETKNLFRLEYRALAPERRNDRGTIVYLLGRNPSAPADWAFLQEAVIEPPCLSLRDCSHAPPPGGEDTGGDEVTLAYPALVALKQAQRALEKTPASEGALGVLEAARSSRSAAVARLAARLAQQRPPPPQTTPK